MYPGFDDSLRAPNSKSGHSKLRHPPLPPAKITTSDTLYNQIGALANDS